MKQTANTARDSALRNTVAQLEESILALFGGFPSLCGFSVQERKGSPEGGSEVLQDGLFLTDVGLYPTPNIEEAKLICEDIRDTSQLIDEAVSARAAASRTSSPAHFH
jgi:hypothetical protein